MPNAPVASLCCAIALALSANASCQDRPPSLDRHEASWWNAQLTEDGEATRTRLVALGARSLPMLSWLVEHGGDQAQYQAARALGELGPDGRPACDLLLRILIEADGWWPEYKCADTLARLGDDRPAVRDALLDKITTSEIPRLRSECVQALATLRADASDLLLGAVDAGRFSDMDWAIDALTRLGEAASDRMLGAMDAEGARGHVVREAFVRIGWPVADRLEKLGHADLAHRCLTEGPLRGIYGGDICRTTPLDPEPTATLLPALLFAHGNGHGNGISVWRGADGPEGFRIRTVRITRPRSGPAREWAIHAREASIPRKRALALTRQLAMLDRLEINVPNAQEISWSSGNFCTFVQRRRPTRSSLNARSRATRVATTSSSAPR